MDVRDRLIEVVAKAQARRDEEVCGDAPWDELDEHRRDWYRQDAAAVVDALGVEEVGPYDFHREETPLLYRIKALEAQQ